MIIIRESNKNYLKLLGKNLNNGTKIRLMKYLLIININNGKAIHNELTRAFIWVSNNEWHKLLNNKSLNNINWLWENYFFVNDDYDENLKQEYLKKNDRLDCHNIMYLKQGHIKTFTIFSTMICNARCFYCYEKGRPQRLMTTETAYKVSDYIIRYGIKDGSPIQLRWFGGEPLINEHIIDIICKNIQDTGFNYQSSFTTNGFLFKKDKIKKYNDLWHLKSIQITIDGTEEVYNKIKNYKNIKGINPYNVVMNNIKMLIENNINVTIRMNLDIYNAENIKQLIPEIFMKFGHNPNLILYNYPIFEDEKNPRTSEENKILYKKLIEADEVLNKYGYYHSKKRNRVIRSTQCMADTGHCVIIGTNGDLGLCEHYSEDNFFSHINNPENKQIKYIEMFQEYEYNEELCESCPIKPSCIKLKMCKDLGRCNIYMRDWLIKNALNNVKYMYNNWKQSQNKYLNHNII